MPSPPGEYAADSTIPAVPSKPQSDYFYFFKSSSSARPSLVGDTCFVVS